MKIVYFGTPEFSAIVLEYLVEQNIPIAAVVTQADKPKGRSLQLAYSPVKSLIVNKMLDVPLFQPEKASTEQFIADLRALNADLFVVAAYGQILSQKLLDIPSLGCINVHPSLLPKYRGATPIQSCLLDGVKETGVVIQKMVKQMDAGDLIATAKMEVPVDINYGELDRKLADLSKILLVSVIKMYEQGVPKGIPQNHDEATYTKKVELEEGEIDWGRSAWELHNLIRAFSPKPGAWTTYDINGERKRLKILKARFLPDVSGNPKEIIHRKDAVVACGQDALQLIDVQPEGKKIMTGADWMRGLQSNVLLI